MFTISRDKYELLGLAMTESLLDRMANHVSRAYPERAFDRDPAELRAFLRGILDEAGRFGLRGEATVGRYLEYRLDLGDDLLSHARWRWIVDTLENTSLGEDEKIYMIDTVLYGAPVIKG